MELTEFEMMRADYQGAKLVLANPSTDGHRAAEAADRIAAVEHFYTLEKRMAVETQLLARRGYAGRSSQWMVKMVPPEVHGEVFRESSLRGDF